MKSFEQFFHHIIDEIIAINFSNIFIYRYKKKMTILTMSFKVEKKQEKKDEKKIRCNKHKIKIKIKSNGTFFDYFFSCSANIFAFDSFVCLI